MKNRNDETQRLLSMEYYESVVQNLIKSKSTQVAGAILFHVIDQLKDGTCQLRLNINNLSAKFLRISRFIRLF